MQQTITKDFSGQLQQTLQERFHFKSFRPGQSEAIHSLLECGRLLCIQPTGHGKSLLYQLPAILLSGITIVISPLLALMRDQIDQLNQRFKIAAASINTVIQLTGLAEKLNAVLCLLEQLSGHGIIYCATRENTELVAEYLQNQTINAVAYHAGLDSDSKRQLQNNFINNHHKVIVATNALGMGIDKQDLRFIIHFDMPGSITAYYQEVGRCGRDGELAQGILLFDAADKKIQDYFINSSQPSRSDFQHIMQSIKDSQAGVDITAIKRISGLHPNRVNVVVNELVEQGFLLKEFKNRKQIYTATDKKAKADLSRYENQFQVRSFELKQMVYYGEQTTQCSMELLRKSLGDKKTTPCKHCHICSVSPFIIKISHSAINKVQNWLNFRASMISPSIKNHLAEGVAVLSAQLRSPVFVRFMKERASSDAIKDSELLELIRQYLLKLKNQYSFSTIIPVPSRTWMARKSIAQMVAESLDAKLILDYLYWSKIPKARQGELLNNDQRRYNVAKHMQANKRIKIPRGAVLLLDDYVGSGATLQEAARVLKHEANITYDVVPFTVAMVKWRLGRPGMI